MSGYKSSIITYNRRGELLISLQNLNKNLKSSEKVISLLFELINEKINELDKFNKLYDYRSQIEKCKNDFRFIEDEIKKLDKKFEDAPKFAITKIQEIIDEYHNTSNHLITLQKKLTELDKSLDKIKEFKNLIYQIKEFENNSIDYFNQNTSIIKEWNLEAFNNLIQEREHLLKELNTLNNSQEIKIDEAKNLLSRFRIFFNRVKNLALEYTEKDNHIKMLIQNIEIIRQKLEYVLKDAKSNSISSKIKELLNTLDNHLQNLKSKKIESAETFLNKVKSIIPTFPELDNKFLEIDKLWSQINLLITSKSQELNKWFPSEYQKLMDKKTELKTKFARNLEKSIFHLSDEKHQIDEYLTELEKLLHDIEKLSNDTEEKENLHNKRLYLIKALREVCASLGFKEIDKPDYELKNDPNSPVIQNFDTLNAGVIKFIFNLDGKLETDSNISIDNCGNEFSTISEILKEQFGVETDFKIVEEPEPNRNKKSAKDLPKSSDKKQIKGYQ